MLVDGQSFQTVWAVTAGTPTVRIIDQRLLPWKFEVVDLKSVEEVAVAIKDMWVRGAGCIGATAGYGMWLAAVESAQEDDFLAGLERRAGRLRGTRPTAVNLAYAVDRQLREVAALGNGEDREAAVKTALATARAIAEEDVAACQTIGEHGLKVIEALSRAKNGGVVNVLTHCNAGWLAFVDHGSATAPIYAAQQAGIAVHVWVDETRPRNQGARLTAWELSQQGVPHTVICDNTGGHLMQHGLVDMVITGADRVSCQGDVANKIGTYLKALAARDNGVPFYVALPSSTIDWNLRDGVRDIPIEQRGDEEVRVMEGRLVDSSGVQDVVLFPENSAAANYAFDVTPARLITGLITEEGLCKADEVALRAMHHR
jgi:methylthioribose-1-phosphate isomerase